MSDLRNNIQSAVASLDTGVGRALLRGLLCVLLGAMVFGLYARTQFRGLDNAAAMEAANIARNLSAGQGFATQVIRPVDFWHLDREGRPRPGADRLPSDLRHAPLWPALLAGGFKLLRPSFAAPTAAGLFAPETKVIVPLGILLCIATGLLLLLLGKAMFDDRSAFLALVLLFLSPPFLKASLSGTYLPAATFFATATLTFAFFSVRAMNHDASWPVWLGHIALSGVFCAAACLTAYGMLILLPLVLFWLYHGLRERRGVGIAVLLTVFSLAVAPWIIRNLNTTGGPWGMAHYSILEQSLLYPRDAFARSPEPEMHNVRIANAVKAKFSTNALGMFHRGFGLPLAGIMAAFFLVALFGRFEDQDTDRFKWHVVLGLFLAGALLALRGVEGPDLLLVFLPMIVVLGSGFFFVSTDRISAYQSELGRLFSIGVVGVTALPLLLTLSVSRPAIPYPPYYPPLQAYAAQSVLPDEIICTDIPEATAWYGNRRSLLLPNTIEEFLDLRAQGLPCNALYLTTRTASRAAAPESQWAHILNRQIPESFPFQDGVNLPPGSDDQLLLSSRSPQD